MEKKQFANMFINSVINRANKRRKRTSCGEEQPTREKNTITDVYGTHWGDEGKGKIATALAPQSDIVLRSTGGANAGHTIKKAGVTYTLHLVPGGLVHGVPAMITEGVVIDPAVLVADMKQITDGGITISPKNFMIAENAHVIFPIHMNLDKFFESCKNDPVGTTGRGIGPAYMTKANRDGIRMMDLLLPADQLAKKIKAIARWANILFASNDEFKSCVTTQEQIRELAEQYVEYGDKLQKYINNTQAAVDKLQLIGGINFLIEGAQANRLRLGEGDYPDVTSSNPSPMGSIDAAGLSAIGAEVVVAACSKGHCSRVGNGQFPSEQDNEVGNYIREIAHEYGTTTGRPRRCGWPDWVILKGISNQVSYLCLNHFDTLGKIGMHFGYLNVCVKYRYQGDFIEYVPHLQDGEKLEPVYQKFEGAGWDIPEGCKTYEELPEPAKKYIEDLEKYTGIPVKMIGIGADNKDLIVRNDV